MSRSQGDVLLSNLLENRITSSELDTKLGIIGYLSGFKYLVNNEKQSNMLVNDSTAFGLIANSTIAVTAMASNPVFVEELVKNSNALYTLVTTANLFNAFKNNAQNWSLLNSFVNEWFSKLKKQTFLADGTFSIPSEGLKAMSIVGCGCGGESNGVGGGSGSESGVNTITSSLPSENLTITVGTTRKVGSVASPYESAGSSVTGATAGNLLVLNGGYQNITGTSQGGGSNTGGNFSNGNLTASPWQFEDCTKKGGNGGFGNGVAGSAGIFGSGGAAETISAYARPGNGFCSGGGGSNTGGIAALDNVGSQATGYGCGSGASDPTVYDGGQGIIIIHYIIN